MGKKHKKMKKAADPSKEQFSDMDGIFAFIAGYIHLAVLRVVLHGSRLVSI